MKKAFGKWQKIVALTLCLLMIALIMPQFTVNAGEKNTAQLPFRELTVDEIVTEMGTGINLGNTMDGHTDFAPNETIWQPTMTTQKYIDAAHDLGFNTIRVPVTWGQMINDDYSINDSWISRVQDIVDYAVSQDMYVIVNIHHDGTTAGWINIKNPSDEKECKAVYDKFGGVWTTIAERFKDYDEHLIFESMNEVLVGPGNSIQEDYTLINNLNQVFVDSVRATGSNNAKRWLSVPGRNTDISSTCNLDNGFEIPKDSVENRIFVSVHYYDYNFGLKESMDVADYSEKDAATIIGIYQKLIDTFTSKGIPVILGEYGAINKNDTDARAFHYEVVTAICKMAGVVPVAWDQGWYDFSREPADYSFTLIDRETGEAIYPSIIAAMLRGTFIDRKTSDLASLVESIKKVPDITSVSAINISKDTYVTTIGDVFDIDYTVEPTDVNEIITWSTSNKAVATIYNGKVIARGIGAATLTAATASGVKATVNVMVNADKKSSEVTDISTDKAEYNVSKEGYFYITTTITGNDEAYVTYKSSNPDVATVDRVGKVVGVSNGVTYITITASTGLTKTVKVLVGTDGTAASTGSDEEMELALNIYNLGEYFGNLVGKPITVNGNGQYTVVFDCETDLTDDAKVLGVSSITDFGAIYIKDYGVTTGKALVSPITGCDITYDSINVDGIDIPVTDTSTNSAMKGTCFDSGKPFNAWDGSVADTESSAAGMINFVGITNPQKITVTFTLSNYGVEAGDDTKDELGIKTTDSIEFSSELPKKIKAGQNAEITVKIAPVDAGKITVVSSDESIAYVDATALAANVNGEATFTVTGMSNGKATITAMSEDGKTVSFDVSVKGGSSDAKFPILVVTIIVTVVLVAIIIIIGATLCRKYDKIIKEKNAK